jgi:hypothetical protein
MSLRPILAFVFAVALSTGLLSNRAQAEETEPRLIGVGYKIGNGLGVVGGDVIVRAIPHVTFDLQANFMIASSADPGGASATGIGLAPTVQLQWSPVGHTPYLGLGPVYARLSSGDITASAFGVVFNAGYEWRFASGMGILVGAGAGHLGEIHATNGIDTVSAAGGWFFNLEAGVRYYFL